VNQVAGVVAEAGGSAAAVGTRATASTRGPPLARRQAVREFINALADRRGGSAPVEVTGWPVDEEADERHQPAVVLHAQLDEDVAIQVLAACEGLLDRSQRRRVTRPPAEAVAVIAPPGVYLGDLTVERAAYRRAVAS
jgi:hypothetical protein